jgi:hypothetical protein
MTDPFASVERVYGVLSPYVLVLRDELPEKERLERLNFHLAAGDYFPLLATILGFAEESLSTCSDTEGLSARQVELLRSVKKDLMHLHANYRIVRKDP